MSGYVYGCIICRWSIDSEVKREGRGVVSFRNTD